MALRAGFGTFLWDNLVDLASTTLAADSEELAMPDTRLQQLARWRKHRSTAGTSTVYNITLDGSGATGTNPVNVGAVVDFNGTDTGEIRLQAWTDSLGGATEVFDQTIQMDEYPRGVGTYGAGKFDSTVFDRNVVLFDIDLDTNPSAEFARYWRYTLTDTNTSYQQASRVFLGQGVQFQVNYDYGRTSSRRARSTEKIALGGQRYTQPRPSPVEIGLVFENLTAAEETELQIRERQHGEHSPFIFALSPGQTLGEAQTQIYGHFEGFTLVRPRLNLHRWQTSVVEDL